MGNGRISLAGMLLGIGGIGVIVVAAIYASASPLASVPLPVDGDLRAALEASRAGVDRLRMAGLVGINVDVVLMGGAALLAVRNDRSWSERLAWIWIGLSTGLFVFVDITAGLVLHPLLAQPGLSIESYAAVRGLYDAFFSLGVGVLGAAFVALSSSLTGLLRIVSAVAALIALAAYGLHLIGATQPLLLGASVGLGGLIIAIFGWREVRGGPSDPRLGAIDDQP